MKQLLLALSIVLLLQLLVHSCANPISPTGGPKDTIPPKLITAYPETQTLNFKDQTIVLTFDEYINADKLKQSLIVTPITELKYKSYIKKRTLTLNFEKPFQDSTTYTLNFFDGVTDITEKNPVENLIIAFSTGAFIDSLTIQGYITNIYSNDPSSKFTVGLYKLTDSLDFKVNKPTYFTTSTEKGLFSIQNIKSGNYKLLAFNDKNKNLLFNPKDESFAFLKDTLQINQISNDTIRLKEISIDASDLLLTSARPSGHYFEARYTKPIINYNVKTINGTYLPTKIVGESETIRFYPISNSSDSLQTIITAQDTLLNTTTDTLFVKFRESSKKLEEFKLSIIPKSNSDITENPTFTIKFNKPVQPEKKINVSLAIDTLINIPLSTTASYFNDNNTTFTYSLNFTPSIFSTYIDSLDNIYSYDTLKPDSTHIVYQKAISRIGLDKFQIMISENSFISCEQDSSYQIINTYSFIKPEKYGTIKVHLTTEKKSYTVQLMNKQKVEYQLNNCIDCTFQKIKPGSYWVRILYDSNNDGSWTFGNYLKKEEPEPLYYFKEETTLRANWEVELKYEF